MSAQPVISYIRVSGPDQTVRRQRNDLADDVAEHDLVVEAEHTDEGISASLYATKIRNDYEALVALIASNEVDGKTIWLSEASRMSRNMEAFGSLRKLCREHKIKWFLSNKGRSFDLTRDADLTEVTALIHAAEAEIFTLTSRIRSGVRNQVREQKPSGRVPFGYRRTYDESRAKADRFVAQEVHQVYGPIVTGLAARNAAGEGARAIARDLTARGVPTPSDANTGAARRPWTEVGISRLATCPTYVGVRRYQASRLRWLGATRVAGQP